MLTDEETMPATDKYVIAVVTPAEAVHREQRGRGPSPAAPRSANQPGVGRGHGAPSEKEAAVVERVNEAAAYVEPEEASADG